MTKDILEQDKICRGCLYYDKNFGPGCSVRYMKDNKSCPCSICLVKMTCKETCQAFISFEKESTSKCRKIFNDEYLRVSYIKNGK